MIKIISITIFYFQFILLANQIPSFSEENSWLSLVNYFLSNQQKHNHMICYQLLSDNFIHHFKEKYKIGYLENFTNEGYLSETKFLKFKIEKSCTNSNSFTLYTIMEMQSVDTDFIPSVEHFYQIFTVINTNETYIIDKIEYKDY